MGARPGSTVNGVDIPERCPVCNREAAGPPVTLDIGVQRKKRGLVGAIGSGIERLRGWNYTGPVAVNVFYCPRHRARKRNRILAGLAIAAMGVAYLTYAYLTMDENKVANEAPSTAAILAIGGLVGGVAVAGIPMSDPAFVWFKPRRFADRTVWVTGAGKAFLKSLPTIEKDDW